MLATLATIAILMAFFAEELENSSVVFWLETLMLEAFGVSWLIKGETLFRDRNPAGEARLPPAKG
jgi:hypothetical protein